MHLFVLHGDLSLQSIMLSIIDVSISDTNMTRQRKMAKQIDTVGQWLALSPPRLKSMLHVLPMSKTMHLDLS